jgi:squalene-hopene/tetraprenyl-beta-curcumene cyclase
LRAAQATHDGGHGGWPLFHDGAFNLSCSVKAYFALKAIGDDPDALHMRRARDAILAAGGAERSNVFTRAQLALFGEVPWRAVPVMPLEIMHLPLWFPFHLSKVSSSCCARPGPGSPSAPRTAQPGRRWRSSPNG